MAFWPSVKSVQCDGIGCKAIGVVKRWCGGPERQKMSPKSLIIGAGAGLSASLARALAERGHQVILAARDTSDLSDLAEATGAVLID